MVIRERRARTRRPCLSQPDRTRQNDASQEQVADRSVRDEGVEHHGDGWRNDRADDRGRACQRSGVAAAIALLAAEHCEQDDKTDVAVIKIKAKDLMAAPLLLTTTAAELPAEATEIDLHDLKLAARGHSWEPPEAPELFNDVEHLKQHFPIRTGVLNRVAEDGDPSEGALPQGQDPIVLQQHGRPSGREQLSGRLAVEGASAGVGRTRA